jgi:hypothetical protein
MQLQRIWWESGPELDQVRTRGAELCMNREGKFRETSSINGKGSVSEMPILCFGFFMVNSESIYS